MTDRRDGPPPMARSLLERCVPEADRRALIGDLDEEFRVIRLPRLGRAAARRWYWRQALRSAITARARRGPGHYRPIPSAHTGNGDSPMSQVLQDVRYGMRTLVKTPTFTILTILTLALAIGVNTAIFSMMNVLFLQSLPMRDQETIGFIYTHNPGRGIERAYLSPADFLELRRELDALTDLSAVVRGRPFVLTGRDEPERVTAFEATANTFGMWGVTPTLGRTFLPGEDAPGAEPVAILSHGYWERAFASDPGAVGSTIELDGIATTIVGVMDPEMEFGTLAQADLWTPLHLVDSSTDHESRNLWTSGRLAPGATLEQAAQEVQGIWSRLQAEHPEQLGAWSAIVFDMHQVLAPPDTWTIFYLLFLTVGFVLLIACSNVATMMVARSSARSREISVRAALGAGRRRIVAQLVTESILLSLSAGVLGLVLARACLMALVWMAGDNSGISNFFALLEIDRNVLLFTLAVSVLAPIVFGLLPALRASRLNLADTLKEGTRGNSATGGLRLRRGLVAFQIALALSLMVVAGLTIQAILEMRSMDLGFDPEGLLTLRLDLPETGDPTMSRAESFFDEVERRLGALPGVDAVIYVGNRLGAELPPQLNFVVEGRPEPEPEERPWAIVNTISSGGLSALGLPVQRGREFDASDTEDARPVAVINTDAAERFWPDADPIGQRIRFATSGEAPRWLEIVGITEALPTGDPRNPTAPEVWIPLEQNPRRGLGLLVRASGDPLAIAEGVRREIWAVDPDQPIGDMRTMDQIIQDFLAAPRTIVSMFAIFAVFALAMAAAGIYGVMAFAVSQRTQEIGIRMALGARGGDVARMIARQATWMIAIGVAVGSLTALALARMLTASVMVGSGIGWLPLLGVVVTLSAAAAIATLVPARRALRIDPIIALRSE